MSAQVTDLPPGAEAGGIEGRIARLVPRVMLAGVAMLGVIWWMSSQPPAGPGWDDPNAVPGEGAPVDPNVDPRGRGRRRGRDRDQVESRQSSACSGPAAFDCGSCVSGLDCGDCVDCGDCLSNIDCGAIDCGDCSGVDCSCTVAGARAQGPVSMTAPGFPDEAGAARWCSLGRLKRLAGPSGFLLPLVVLIGWRRRLRR